MVRSPVRPALAAVTSLLAATLMVAAALPVSGADTSPQPAQAVPAGSPIPPDGFESARTHDLAHPRIHATATLPLDGRVVVIGGYDQASAEIWDPRTGEWAMSGSMPGPREGHTATLLPDGLVVVRDGHREGDETIGPEVWDPATGEFGPAGSLPDDLPLPEKDTPGLARVGASQTTLLDGRVLVAGGRGPGERLKGESMAMTRDGPILAAAELIDLAAHTYTPLAPVAIPRTEHTATLLADGRVLLVGSHTHDDALDRTAEVFGPKPASGAASDTAEASSSAASDPASSAALTGVTSIAVGGEHSCALTGAGRVWCWGGGRLGQLGTGERADSPVAVQVEGIEGATAIAAGAENTCALLEGAQVWCWGWNANAELVGVPDPAADDSNPDVLSPVEIPELRGATDLVMRYDDPCVLLADGIVRCRRSMWEAFHVRLGEGATEVQPTPGLIDEAKLPGVVAVAAESRHMCALMSDRTVGCWGHIHEGSLGDGVTQDSQVPIHVDGVEGATTIAMNDGRTCAVVAAGRVLCWGIDHWDRDTGAVVDLVPQEIPGLIGATQVSMREAHACALIDDGTIRCWGSNDYGELGDGTRTDSASPVEVAGLTDAVSVAVGYQHGCALTSAGEVRCWGSNRTGQLGNGLAGPALGSVVTDVVRRGRATPPRRAGQATRRRAGTPSPWPLRPGGRHTSRAQAAGPGHEGTRSTRGAAHQTSGHGMGTARAPEQGRARPAR